ncbi:MAG TPA: energy transducer TonB [Pyrinomonadaceae bacterium]|nr:energy transducer TonB [Pyrinomonadaceae bacterium]
MFNNLIESTSHVKEFKRRGSFVLLTTVTYGVLLVAGGIASVYAYDAHLDSQNTELEITFVPLLENAAQPAPPRNTAAPRPASSNERPATQPERTDLFDTINPNNPPKGVSTTPHLIPPAPPGAIVTGRNIDPDVAIGSHFGTPGGTSNTPQIDVGAPPPPPAPTPKPEPPKILKISRILNSQAISLPKPNYPPMAKQIRLQGMVSVQVLIDETGKVISANPTGHPLLVAEAKRAAMQARFSPTIVGETPVKVSGVITYNFVMP